MGSVLDPKIRFRFAFFRNVGYAYRMICLCNSRGDLRHASVDLLAVDGAEFKLLCPNSETVARIVAAFLYGLKRRSRWAVALDQSVVEFQGHLSTDI